MSKINDGGPAYPTVVVHWNGTMIDRGPGMTLRDYFAAKAMQAMVSTYITCARGDKDGSDLDLYTPGRDLLIDENSQNGECEGANEVSVDAYKIADAMIKARESDK